MPTSATHACCWTTPTSRRPPFSTRSTHAWKTRRLLAWTALALSIVALAAVVFSSMTRVQPSQPSVHLSIALPPGEQATTIPAIAPDGRTIAYASGRTRETSHVYLRSIDSSAAKVVDASLGGQLPFFSPDGRSLAFFAGGKMRRVPVSGGASTTIADATRSWGGDWCGDGTIVRAEPQQRPLARLTDAAPRSSSRNLMAPPVTRMRIRSVCPARARLFILWDRNSSRRCCRSRGACGRRRPRPSARAGRHLRRKRIPPRRRQRDTSRQSNNPSPPHSNPETSSSMTSTTSPATSAPGSTCRPAHGRTFLARRSEAPGGWTGKAP